MVDSVDITDGAVRDLLFLVEHLDEADRIVRESKQMPIPATFKELYAQISPGSTKDARRIVRSLSNIRDFMQDAKITSEETFDLLTDALERKQAPLGWPEASRTEWLNSRSRVVGLLNQIDDKHPFVVLQKASDLTYAHEKVLRNARIITDVRPVFLGDSDEIVRGIAVHRLLIEYTTGDTSARIEFALDAADIALLRKLCHRAESKATAIRKSLAPVWPIVVPREKDAQ